MTKFPAAAVVEAEVMKAFGAKYRWTATDALQGQDLTGKDILVTGGTSGIGVEAVLAFVGAGAKVTVTARSEAKGKELEDKCKGLKGELKVWACDLASFASVDALVKRAVAENAMFDVVLNNAGVMALANYTETGDKYEMQLQVNYLSPAILLTGLLREQRVKDNGRIVVVSSIAHAWVQSRFGGYSLDKVNWNDKEKYNKWAAYCMAKGLACLLACYLGRTLKARRSSITVNPVHPGGIMTNLQSDLSQDEVKEYGWVNEAGEVHPGFKTVSQGASTLVYAAVSPDLKGVTAAYLENCQVTPAGEMSDADAPVHQMYGAGGYIVDAAAQEELIRATEETLARKLVF